MVRAIVWKEFREQGLIGLTLVVLGSGVLVAVATLADRPQAGAPPGDVLRALGPGPLATLLLAVTAGTVCGGALFAAEREAGTHGFLEALPVPRARIWVGKVVAGGLLMAAQAGAVIAAGLALGLLTTPGWAVAVAVYSFLAFCWGVLGSTLARTTLGSVGVAVPAATLFSVAYLFPILLAFQVPGTPVPRPPGAALFLALMFGTPLIWSAVAYTRPDRDREADERVPPPPAVFLPTGGSAATAAVPVAVAAEARRPRLGVKALVWLSARQLAGPGPALAGFAVAAGLALLTPTLEPFLVWPGVALLAGVLAGVTAFADEQANGSARYWGERRLPAGRMWAVKLAVHLGFALFLALLVATPLALRAAFGSGGVRGDGVLTALFRSLLFDARNLGPEGWKYVLAPLGYGFAAGAVCGMLFKKPVVGAGVAGVVGGMAFAVWLPSLLAGGVWHLWVWLPPAVALAAGRGVLRPWAAERVGTRRGLVPLAAGGLGLIAVLAAGVGFRAVEVPDEGGATDDLAYVTGLVPFDQNRAGREFRTAAEQFARSAALTPPPLPSRTRRLADRVEQFRVGEFAATDRETVDWVAAVHDLDRAPPGPPGMPREREQPWYALAAAGADPAVPVGLFEHPIITPTTGGSLTLENGRAMAAVLLARGVFRQAAGDPAAFPDDLRAALAVARSMRNGSIVAALNRGNDVTLLALSATARWLGGLDGRPDLARRALDEVLRDERAVMTRVTAEGEVVWADVPADGWGEPFDPTPHLLADRYVLREQMRAPAQWLPEMITPPGRDKESAEPVVDLVGFAWSVPWERERTRRLVAYGLDGGHGDAYRRLTRGRPGAGLLTVRSASSAELRAADLYVRACRRATAVQLAARLYRHDRGGFPPDVAALAAAGYLPGSPPDPYSPAGAPLRYRVPAADEFLRPSAAGPGRAAGEAAGPGGAPRAGATEVPVRAGQPVVWSVGADRTDEGGRSMPVNVASPVRVADLVFLVPLPPENP